MDTYKLSEWGRGRSCKEEGTLPRTMSGAFGGQTVSASTAPAVLSSRHAYILGACVPHYDIPILSAACYLLHNISTLFNELINS